MPRKIISDIYFFNGATKLNNVAIPAASFNTNKVEVDKYSGEWIIEIFRTVYDDSATFTLEYSMDNSNWFEYDPATTNVPISGANYHVPPIKGGELLPKYIRISFTLGGNESGNITARMFLIETNPFS